ncbi:cyclic GMP-AMP synthase-like [Polypterus senegalus]|uniref:cyclic GMP-AMP synthase-like n=1 Tax=Polypterus senegalus TaxID=55291 RepID=UPI001963E130|nr:cyclic GMP-AMP synthase-like [Polypterus senegalus]
MMSNLQVLEQIYQGKVDFSAPELDPYKTFAESVVHSLLTNIQTYLKPGDPKISKEPIGTGSSFEGVKVKPDLEFDFMVPMDIKYVQIIFSNDDHNVPVCYGLIQIEQPKKDMQSTSKCDKDTDFKEKFCMKFGRHGHLLSAKSIQEWFQSLCAKTLPELSKRFSGISFTFRTSGPARTLVFNWRGKEMNIDIVPAVPYKHTYLVAKMSSHLGEAAWRLSFSKNEKTFFHGLSPNSCYFKCLKILKYLRENDKKMCPSSQLTSSCPSYFLKTAFFHQVLKIDKHAWQNKDLEDRMKDLLQYLANCMKQRHLAHIFMGNRELEVRRDSWVQGVPSEFFSFKNTNLLKDFNPGTLDQIRLRLVYIHDNLGEVLQTHLRG